MYNSCGRGNLKCFHENNQLYLQQFQSTSAITCDISHACVKKVRQTYKAFVQDGMFPGTVLRSKPWTKKFPRVVWKHEQPDGQSEVNKIGLEAIII